MIDQPQFKPFAQINGFPPAWAAAVWPWWTLVITRNPSGKFAASARDVRDVLHPTTRHSLGADFATLEAAQAACCDFLRKQEQ